jgi:hypothetical protein
MYAVLLLTVRLFHNTLCLAAFPGGSPGRVAEISPNLTLVAEHPRSGKNTNGFNPHGLALSAPSVGRFVTLDYLEYGSVFKPSREIV